MYILSVIPISRGIPFSTLSYYHTENLSAGSLVEIPLGRNTILGLVYDSTSLIEAKSLVKQSSFSLKKIKSFLGTSLFGMPLVEGLKDASAKTLTPIGALANIVIGELFVDTFQKIGLEKNKSSELKIEPSCSYGDTQERADFYKRIIRSAFAEKKSVVFVAPTIASLEFWFNILQKGISSHSAIIHSKKTKKDQRIALSLIKNSERPIFICTTAQNAFIPREDVSTVILEDESSSLYKTQDRYNADMRIVLRSICDASGIKVIYGDILPRFETLIETNTTLLPRTFNPDKLSIVENETYRTDLPTEIVELIRYCQKNKKSLFIYTNRKGLAPISRCADCGTSVDCKTCGLPIVLRYKIVGGEKERMFVCTHCGDSLPSSHICSYCASWNINPVSIGTESIKDFVKDIVGQENIISIDDDLVLDSKETTFLISEIQKRKWSIMIGTQKLLPFIKQIDFVAIPFFDRIVSTPSPFTVEDTLRLIMTLNEKTKDTLVLCTKKIDFPMVKSLSTKKVQEIISTDIENRETLLYPPFGTLIKLSITGASSHVEITKQKVGLFFNDFENTMLNPRRISPASMKILCIWIIQVPNTYLYDYGADLEKFLIDLRYPYKIEINPSRLS